MIRVREGELTDVSLHDSDVVYLSRLLRGNASAARTQLHVRRLAGLWALPSGRTLMVEPRKGQGSDLFAWICAVDPRLLGYSTAMSAAGTSTGSVVEVAARTFCALLMTTLRLSGSRRQYRERRDLCASVRGRIDWSAYARETLPLRVPCIHWERELDTPLNRLFALVLKRLATEEVLRRATAGELSALLDFFGHVPTTPPPSMLDLERPLSRLDAAFEGARRLAIILLECLGLTFAGRNAGFTFQVDLARLFEQSVEHALLSQAWPALPAFQWRPRYHGDSPGEGGWSAVDALVQTKRGRLVVDAKYATAFSKAHLYQVLAYMKMTDSSLGLLVYPTGAELTSRRFFSDGPHGWTVVVAELDPVRIGQLGTRALREFGEEVEQTFA